MEYMKSDGYVDSTPPVLVRLHLHRGIGAIYGVVAAAVLTLTLLSVVEYASSGGVWMAVVTVVVGLALTTFLAVLTLALVLPELNASATGITGRTAWGKTVDVTWRGVTVDVDDEDPPGTLRLDMGGQPMSIDGRSWVGFRDFVILMGCAPYAASQLTPAARSEVARLLTLQA